MVTRSEKIIRDIKDGIITFTQEGIVTSFNPAAERIFCCLPENIIGKAIAPLLIPAGSERQSMWQRPGIDTTLDIVHEVKGRRHNGDHFVMEFTVTRGCVDDQMMYTCVVKETTERKQAEEAKRLKALSLKISESQEEERRRVARELHDGINPLLVSVKYKLEAAEYEIEQQGMAMPNHIGKASLELDSVIQEVRRISRGLRSSVLDVLGLFPALDNLSREFSERTGIVVDPSGPVNPGRLPAEIETALYRVAQEAFTNIEKHADASRVAFQKTWGTRFLTVRIQDDGKGFNVNKVLCGRDGGVGIGLKNMQERLNSLGCWLCIHSVPSKGALVLVKIPLKVIGGDNEIFS